MKYLLSLVVALLMAKATAAQPVMVASPDGRTVVTVVTPDGVLTYRVDRDGQPLLLPSRLGVVLDGGDTLGVGMRIADVATSTTDETWTQPWGEAEQVRDHHNELRLTLEETSDDARQMVLVFRVFDDGVGFRYEWPEQEALGVFEIIDELTAFRFAANPESWWIRAYENNRYEYLYEQSPLDRAGYVLHTPVTMAFPDGGPFVAVHEAALVDYSAMQLRRIGPTAFQADLAPWSTGVRVYAETPHRSSWRVLLIGDTPGDLVTNYTVLNLNEPNALGDVSWVRPGKYVGIWWAMHLGQWSWSSGPNHGATNEHTKRYIDFAAEHGFDGVLVEGWNLGWDGDWTAGKSDFSFTEPYPDYDLDGLAAYALERGTRLIGHHETGAGIPNYEAQMDDAFALMNRLGVEAVKTGYVDWGMHFPHVTAAGDTTREWNYGQAMVNHYQRSVEAAARHRVSVNIHEPVKDTGLRRTYPNLMTREGARGQEYNAAWGGGNGPDHVPTLVFTRMLAGPMDFTPGIFDLAADGENANAVPTTLAGQLALYVILYSPLQMAADLVENYAPHMDAFQFIKDVPVDWADTRVLEAKIGDYVTIARKDRHSDDWYLGAKNDATPHTVDVTLDFLDVGQTYTATIYRDGDGADWESNPLDYVIERRTVRAGASFSVDLASGGGLAVRFAPDN